MMRTTNTGNLRRSSVMPGKGQIYKKPMKKAKAMSMKKSMKKDKK